MKMVIVASKIPTTPARPTPMWFHRGMADGAQGDRAGGWVRLRRRVTFRSDWFEVRRDDVLRPDGSRGEYDHVQVPDSVTVLAMDGNRNVLVTRQWIYVHGGTQWRLPSGRMDGEDRSPEDAARRELAEETGVAARRWAKVGVVHGSDSFTNHREHVFVATDLRPAGEPALEPGEADLSVHWLGFDQVLGMVRAGEMPHAGSAFAVLMAESAAHGS